MNRSRDGSCYAPRLLRREIIDKAEKLIDEYARIVGQERILKTGLWFDDVYEQVIYPKYEIDLTETDDLGLARDGTVILGAFAPQLNSAYVTNRIAVNTGDPRRSFTCWHEVGGHGVLQGEWLRKRYAQIAMTMVTGEKDIAPNAVQSLERQANLFAAHAAAPTWLVQVAIRRTFGLRENKRIRYVGRGPYMLCVRGNDLPYKDVASYSDLCRIVAGKIKHLFGGLSVESLGYRVAESRLVVDVSKTIGCLYRLAG